MLRSLVVLLLLLPSVAVAQDTLSILYYNVLNYPGNTPERADTLRKITDYYQPDLVLINELESEAGADTILNRTFNPDGGSTWARAPITNGPNTENMLYYRTDKVGFESWYIVETGGRFINEYLVYSKEYLPTDTVYLRLYSLHLKASQGWTNENQRATEAGFLRKRLNSIAPGNIIVGGDFNVYTSAELCYDTLLNTGSPRLFDPIASPGNWHTNSFYADIHTQSTRSSALNDGSGGGLDDRFDIILVSGDVLLGNRSVRYIAGTYQALGQDGTRYNDGMNDLPNGSVPDSIALALYYMSVTCRW